MTNFTLKTVDPTGNLIAENNMTIKEGSVFILTPPEGAKIDFIKAVHKIVMNGLQNDRVSTLCPGFKIQVVEIE